MTPRKAVEWSLLAFCAALPVSIAGLNAAATALSAALLWAAADGEAVPWRAALTRLSAALVVYLIVGAITSWTGVLPSVSFRMFYKDAHKLWLLMILLVGLRLARPKQGLAAILLGTVFASAIGIGQVAFWRSHDPVFMMIRARGFVHPVIFGEMIGLIWLGVICYWLRSDDLRQENIAPAGPLAALAIIGLAFVFNQTRGALLGVGAGLLAVGLAHRDSRKVAWAVMLFSPIVLLSWEFLPTGHTFHAMFARMHQSGPNSFLARLTLWRVGLQVFRDHPWLGVGPGNYKTVFTHYFRGSFDGESVWGSAHDLYIHQAAERGLLGLAALAGVLYTMTARALARVRARPDAANLWAYGACVAFLVMNLTEVAYQTEQVMSLMLFIWAWAEARPEAASRL